MDIKTLRDAHKLLTEFKYELGTVERGYTNRTLYINISDNIIKSKPVTQLMKDKFIGGKGFGLWYLWNAVTPETKWNDPENEIVIAGGPICGITQYPGAGKSLVCTISPLTHIPIDSNVGGYFGPYLKFSGWDALEIQGKAEKDVIIYIDGNKGIVTIEEAPLEAIDGHVISEELTEMYADSEEDKKNISVISAGTASDYANIGILNFSFYDLRRQVARLKQAGRGGIGRVFRDKKIKAIVIKFKGTKGNLNNPANQSLINKAGIKLHKQIHDLDDVQCRMRKIGTANIIEIMDEYDLLPVHNYQYGSHPDTHKIESNVFIEKYITQNMPDGCWYGCSLSCAKAADNFELKTGPYKGHKVTIDGPEYENAAGLGANCGIFDPEIILEANFYCDTYGVDTISFGTICAFVMECYERGIINKEITGGLELNFGNGFAQLELLHQMSRGEGFGYLVGLGVRRLKEIFVRDYGADPNFLNDIGMEQKGLEVSEYLPKESLAQQGGYGLTNKGPQHDEAWLIFMDMVNNQIPTFEDKAEALHYFPMFRTWFGLMGLCKLPWNDTTPANNAETDEPAKIPEHVQNYVDLFNGITGMNIDKHELIRQSERVYNFQRVFNIRMGKGLRKHDAMPYRSMGPVTVEEYESRQERYDKQLRELVGYDPEGKTTEEKIKVMRTYREDQYEKLTDAVYKRRGWTPNGVPTIEHLKEIGMDLPEVIEVVKPHLQQEACC
ncbi:aldehyde ferredoxin oxidoreductase family protein [Paramaledivibacter caminithermalis]|jgi:aldehyde:ferredoxin oxidoreductase|uniref:Aldehyde:ferredoxin oxidoreductase n=1 Tax=Paramaledivibacter caminithermalis (strain DSM 15212 / CIP 107654 / DViRD3) TaxID=1121301 RepID=A0A1M6PSK0_PARC5|nr:aldehyde ferredoxin oxidoreductase C-terminal domain-containing protein [Paramaledivibacter caminithermalis]SHK10906.1 aldehyde:ferredoxin oxidoreductase [Paramaledivibacter caminithermalis DSM 15212]